MRQREGGGGTARQQQDAWTVSQRPGQRAIGRGLPWRCDCFRRAGCECVRGQCWTDTVAIVQIMADHSFPLTDQVLRPDT